MAEEAAARHDERMRFLPVFVVALFAASIHLLEAEEWARFRGPNGSGLGEGKPVPTKLTEENQLFSVSLPGQGHGAPVVHGTKLFVLAAEEATESSDESKKAGKAGKGKGGKGGNKAAPYRWLALCLDRASGEILWSQEIGEGKFKGHRFNSAASPTPAVDGDRVVFAAGSPEQLLVASFSHEGEKQWESELGPVVGGHGFGGSPILHDGLVVLNNDQEKQNGNLIALDAATGDTAWSVKRRSERISYSVPCVYEADGKDLLVFTNWQHGFTAIDPASGEVVAEKSVFYLETNERAISSPIVTHGMVIGTCGFTANPKHCVAMRLSGGEWEEVWRVERNVPHIPSVIAVGEHVYLIDDSGIGTCLVAATGEEIWRKRLPGVEGAIFGSPVSDGTHLFFVDESGNLHVIAASPEFQAVSTNPLGELSRSTPVIVDGTLYLRTETKLTAWR